MKRQFKSMFAGVLCLAFLPVIPLSASAQVTSEEQVFTSDDETLTEFYVTLEADTFRYTGHGRHWDKKSDSINKSYYGRLETDVTNANWVVVDVGYGFDTTEPVSYTLNGITSEPGSSFNIGVSAQALRERLDGRNLQVGDLLRIENVPYQMSNPAHMMVEMGDWDSVVEYSGNGFELFGEDFKKILRYELYYHLWTDLSDFSSVPVDKGMVNADDKIDLLDVIAVNKNLMTGYELGLYGQLAADVDNNGVVNAVDSLNILKYVVGLIDSFEEIQD